jgi:hypothetical protein
LWPADVAAKPSNVSMITHLAAATKNQDERSLKSCRSLS